MNMDDHDDGQNYDSSSSSSSRSIVDRAMELLDPVPPKQLEPRHVAQAYDLLIDLSTSKSCDDPQQPLHPRLVHAIRSATIDISSNDNSKVTLIQQQQQQQSLSPTWIELQADIYSGLLLSSFLLLELCPRQKDNVEDDDETAVIDNCSPSKKLPWLSNLSMESIQILQQTIERCTLLLQILVQSSFSPTQSRTQQEQQPKKKTPNNLKKDTAATVYWTSQLPTSRYSLIRVAFEGDFIPTNSQQQKEWFESLSSTSPTAVLENQLPVLQEDSVLTIDQNNGHKGSYDNDDDDDEMMIDIDPARLVEDEQTLITMANTEIPVSSSHESSSSSIARQGNLNLVVPAATTISRNDDMDDKSSSFISEEETVLIPVRVKLFRCGLLWLQPQLDKEETTTTTTKYNENTSVPAATMPQQQQQQQQQLWCLNATSTCQLQPTNNEFCFCIDKTQNLLSPCSPSLSSSFDKINDSRVLVQVPSGLAEGSAWVNAIQRIISYNIVNHEQIQQHIQNAWNSGGDGNEEYNTQYDNVVKMVQSNNKSYGLTIV